MPKDVPDLELARRHVAEGRDRVARQEHLIARLRARGQPTELAEQLLHSLTDTLDQMARHCDMLETKAAEL